MRISLARTPSTLALISLLAAPAFAREPFSRIEPATARLLATTAAVRPDDGATLLAVDGDAVRAFRAAGGGHLSVPDAGAPGQAEPGSVELDLVPYDLLAPGTSVTYTDGRGRHPLAADVSLFRGHVTGEPRSWVVLAMGGAGVFGVVERAGQRWTLSPVQRGGAAPLAATLGVHAFAPEGSFASQASRFECGINAGNEAAYGLRPLPVTADRPGRSAAPDAAQLSTQRITLDLAVDCDYEIYHVKFVDDLTAATSYILTVLGMSNLIYERDLETTLKVVYLNLWTTPDDPYTQPTTSGELTEFRNYWLANNGSISSHLRHLISGRGLGGGIAFLDAVCTGNAFAVSAIDANYAYPTFTATWDVNVLTHEMGHNVGSPHTHSCTWAQEGRVPLHSTLDSCQASEGGCAAYGNHLPPDKGTIMSYCHLLVGVANGIRLSFHPVCVTRMREVMSGCGGTPVPLPPRDPTASSVSSGVRLSWTASASPGVLRYGVYRSRFPLDLGAGYIGSKTASPFDNPGLGAYYYRVRAVRSADSSSFSAEVQGVACAFASAAPVSVGASPTAALCEDLNQDGIQDVALLANGSNTLVVMLGQGAAGVGNGNFAAPVSVATGPGPASMAIFDANGDGILDAVVGGQADSSLVLHLGQGTGGVGNGSFGAASLIAKLPFSPTAIATGDFDTDGVTDVAVAGGAGSLVVLRGQGAAGVPNGTFAAPVTVNVGSSTRGLLAYDWNGDGITDLVTSGNGVRVLLGNGTGGHGDGTFSVGPITFVGAQPKDMATGDWNGDGIADLAVCNSGASSLNVLIGGGSDGVPDGTFVASTTVVTSQAPNAVTVGDWDQDGLPDLAVALNNTGNTTAIVPGLGTGAFDAPITYPTGGSNPSFLAVNDFNEDGTPDLLALNRVSGSVSRQLAGCPAALSHALALATLPGGGVWLGGEQPTIRWSKGAGVMTVDLQRSDDSGGHWRTLARGLTGTSYLYTATPPWTTHARFRVVESHAAQFTGANASDIEIRDPASLAVGEQPPRLALLGAWPNPARAELTVSLSLPVGGVPGTLELLDLAGRRVASRDLTSESAGRHQVRLVEGQVLPPGLYLVRLAHAGAVRSMKVAVVP